MRKSTPDKCGSPYTRREYRSRCDSASSRKRFKYDNDDSGLGTTQLDQWDRSTAEIPKDLAGKSSSKNRYHPYQQAKKRNRNHRQSVNRNESKRQALTLYDLKKLSKMDSDDCVADLAGKKTLFDQLLNDDFTPDLLVITLKVLVNICRANFTEIVTSVLSHTCSAAFLRSLENYLKNLPFEADNDKLNNKLYWENKNEFWSNLMQLFETLTELLPTKARDELISLLRKTNAIIINTEMNQHYKIDEKVKDTFLKIYNELNEEMIKFEAANKVLSTSSNLPVTENPPEDFRALSIIPSIHDLNDKNPFIRPSKLEGAYDSVEHYLDVQYRLLREDFISPLRAGIEEYLQGSKKRRNTQLRIYRKVTLIKPEVAGNTVDVILSFGMLRNVNWKHSKRFMFGGLLCLSSDNFNTITFATVANRDKELLANGTILIKLCNDAQITRNMYHSNWIMLESKTYFEPYVVVLNALRHTKRGNFPMKRYLVDAVTSVSLPRYLRPNEKHSDGEVFLEYKDHELPMSANQVWPSAEALQLDDAQYGAFKSALTEEFAIIQGPPGTGKTFIALEIIHTLLENKSYWRHYGPIVIVCLTNHALDQFLVGISKYTSSIVRVGSRSKNESLANYMLTKRRQRVSKVGQSLILQNRKQYMAKCILSNVERTRLALKYLTTNHAIVPFSLLAEYCDEEELKQLNNYDQMLQWLLQDNYFPIKKEIEPGEIIDPCDMEIEEDPQKYEGWRVDDESRFDTKFNPTNCQKPVFILKAMDTFIADAQEELNNYKRSRKKSGVELYTRHYDPLRGTHTQTTMNRDKGLRNRFQNDIYTRQSDSLRELYSKINNLKSQRYDLQCNLNQHPLLMQGKENFNLNPRWQAYWKWVKISYGNAELTLTKLTENYHMADRELNEAKQMVDLKVFQQHDVVGFTTTSAARLHPSLRALCAPIVLVEEAAEILESHVVCSLTKSCQHLILIGDHKQLKPKIAAHKLGKKYNFNVSLFERMINIRGNCAQLAHQHRMRPEIAKLISPSIYETLHNHQSVLEYPSIMGLEKNLFFLNHEKREVSGDNQDTWINPHEAKFLIAFARHLILQGYKSTEITVLCTYTSQLFLLMEERNHLPILKEVRITTIDNYQGEENRIILLSLVRNNEEGYVGFVKEENRVCVALSRAREGLYIMGNMDNLVNKNDVWPKVNEVLQNFDAIGDSLVLRCQFHHDKLINIQTASDFEQCPEGGCLQKCGADLPCGHTCTSICHISDRKHENFRCQKPCAKHCLDEHPCPLKCYQGCEPCQETIDRQLKCGHTVHISCGIDPHTYRCPVKVNAILPHCQHGVKKACYLSLDSYPCSLPCEIRLPCGHSCERNCHVNNDPDHLQYICHKPCAKRNKNCSTSHPCKLQCFEKCIRCPMKVKKKLPCGHEVNVECWGDVKDQMCFKTIQYQKRCGHIKLSVRCYAKDMDCLEEVTKTGPCGHIVKVRCYKEPSLSHCSGNCKRNLACGHPCTARCKDPCQKECDYLIPQTKPGLCGHLFSVPCRLKATEADSPALLPYCTEPCKVVLACGHICKGNCGSCKQGRIHKPCGEKCGNIFICGHGCEIFCRQECPPCQKPCQVKCQHSKCNKKCGEPCTPCREPCAAGCRHTRCLKRCYELCIRKPCTKPCLKLLKCNHPCIGFCGEQCPTLCQICDKKELMDEFFLGYEEEPDARFVLLEDCGHSIESKGLLKWLSECSESIQVKTCPRCRTPISKCTRISNQIKSDLKDVQLVKKKLYGDPEKLRYQQLQLGKEINNMKKHPIFDVFKDMRQLLKDLGERVILITREKKVQVLNVREAEAVQIVLKILQEICNQFEKMASHKNSSYALVTNQITLLLQSLPTRGQISAQEIQDIELELQRLHYMAEICVIDLEPCFEHCLSATDQEPYNFIWQKLVSNEKFSSSIEEEIVKDLFELKKSITIKQERKMIVKAMGFKQGHWYKCPNGHIYSIGECGGAMEQSKCNACGASIGGQSHRLTSGNSVATEMDGATQPAWSGRN